MDDICLMQKIPSTAEVIAMQTFIVTCNANREKHAKPLTYPDAYAMFYNINVSDKTQDMEEFG